MTKYLVKNKKGRLNEKAYYSTELWYSDPADPPTAYKSSSITTTPTRFRGTDIGERGRHCSVTKLYVSTQSESYDAPGELFLPPTA